MSPRCRPRTASGLDTHSRAGACPVSCGRGLPRSPAVFLFNEQLERSCSHLCFKIRRCWYLSFQNMESWSREGIVSQMTWPCTSTLATLVHTRVLTLVPFTHTV